MSRFTNPFRVASPIELKAIRLSRRAGSTSLALLLTGLSLLGIGCSPSSPNPSSPAVEGTNANLKAALSTVWFQEFSDPAGFRFEHTSGHREKFLMPEINTGGVGVLDFDNDGLFDILCVQGGSLYPDATNAPSHQLFRNTGGFRFVDVTAQSGLPTTANGYGMGVACGDANNDGSVDIFITQVGSNRLYLNQRNGTFRDATREAGLHSDGWATSAAWVDYDRDGFLDLLVAHYLEWTLQSEVECFSRGGRPDYCSPLNYQAPAKSRLYRNRGNGTFQDVTDTSGLGGAVGTGLGVGTADFNGDGWPDFYVANDAMPNHLWINQRDGTFKNEAMLRGCAVNAIGLSEAGMGVAVVDLMGRGQWDLFITHLANEFNRVYTGSNGWFKDHTTPKGPGATSWAYTGFGVVFSDFNNDGLTDLYVANGRVRYGPTDLDPKSPYAEPNQFLRGIGPDEFEPVQPLDATLPTLLASSRGLAVSDFDNDGKQDLVVANRDNRFHLLKNIATPIGHFVTLRLLNPSGRDAIGSVVEVTSGGRTQRKQVQPNEGYCSSNDPRLHFGLGTNARPEQVVIHWFNGPSQSLGPLDGDRLHVIRQNGPSR